MAAVNRLELQHQVLRFRRAKPTKKNLEHVTTDAPNFKYFPIMQRWLLSRSLCRAMASEHKPYSQRWEAALELGLTTFGYHYVQLINDFLGHIQHWRRLLGLVKLPERAKAVSQVVTSNMHLLPHAQANAHHTKAKMPHNTWIWDPAFIPCPRRRLQKDPTTTFISFFKRSQWQRVHSIWFHVGVEV